MPMTTEPNEQLQKLLAGAQLPALPQSAIRLLELSQNPDNGPEEFAVPIEADPGLTGQVLRFVNSSYFGFSQEISSVKLAISLVGIRAIKNFALWSAVFSLMPNPKCGPFDLKSLWQDSLRRAVFARRFGRLLGLAEAEDLFAAALLQDMAIPLLARELPADYQDLLLRRAGGRVRLSSLEQETLGWTHAEAAGLIARSWHLPPRFATFIEAHTELKHAADHFCEATMTLSSMLPPTVDDEWFDRKAFVAAYAEISPASAPPAREFLKAVDHEFEEFAPVLKLAVPAKPLSDWFQDDMAPV
jgi:HD-like signal output (HDOD) protein